MRHRKSTEKLRPDQLKAVREGFAAIKEPHDTNGFWFWAELYGAPKNNRASGGVPAVYEDIGGELNPLAGADAILESKTSTTSRKHWRFNSTTRRCAGLAHDSIRSRAAAWG